MKESARIILTGLFSAGLSGLVWDTVKYFVHKANPSLVVGLTASLIAGVIIGYVATGMLMDLRYA